VSSALAGDVRAGLARSSRARLQTDLTAAGLELRELVTDLLERFAVSLAAPVASAP
jgi:hypothetical protein